MTRLDIERQNELEPLRISHAKEGLEKLGIDIVHEDNTKIQFVYKRSLITLFPYSGWHSGKGIKDGRGVQNLLKQLQ